MGTNSIDHNEVESRDKWSGDKDSGNVVIEGSHLGDHGAGCCSTQGDEVERNAKENNNDEEENHSDPRDAELDELLRTKEPSQVFSYQSADTRGRGMHKFLVKVYGRMTSDQVVYKMRRVISDFNFRSGRPPGPRPIPMIIRRLPWGHPSYNPDMDAEPEYGLDPITLQHLRKSRLSPVSSEGNTTTLSGQELAPPRDLPVSAERENRPGCRVAGPMLSPGTPTIHPGLPLIGAKRTFDRMESGQYVEYTRGEAVLSNTLVVNPVRTSIAASPEILSPSPTAREILEQVVYTNPTALDIEFVTPPEERRLGIMVESSTTARIRRRYDLRPRGLGQHRWGSGRNGQ